ncbi:MAG: periplasmic heavy metal sensor [Thermodesulfobacteriota bacterium]
MRKKLLLASVLALTLGFSMTVFGSPFQKLEAFSKLPNDKQQLVVKTMEEVKDTNEELKQQIKDIRQSMKDVLTAQEFDADAYQAYANQIEALRAERFKSTTGAIKDLASQMNQEEREVLVDILPKGKHKNGKHHRAHNG